MEFISVIHRPSEYITNETLLISHGQDMYLLKPELFNSNPFHLRVSYEATYKPSKPNKFPFNSLVSQIPTAEQSFNQIAAFIAYLVNL